MLKSSADGLDVFCGIDVSCGKNKPLPVCFVARDQHRLNVLSVPRALAKTIPRGPGNGEITKATPFRRKANEAVDAIKMIAAELGWRINRIALDAPAKAPSHNEGRACEIAMGLAGLSYFKTPSVSQWMKIKQACTTHMAQDRSLSRLPSANQIWMLYGFELFEAFADTGIERIETYPQAVVRSMLPDCEHKTTEAGYRKQLSAIAAATGWKDHDLEAVLARQVRGSRDDKLDAYMTAWIASLPLARRKAFGHMADNLDAIWVPLA